MALLPPPGPATRYHCAGSNVLSPALLLTPRLQSGPWPHRWLFLVCPSAPRIAHQVLMRRSHTLRSSSTTPPRVQTVPHADGQYSGHHAVGPLLAGLGRTVTTGPTGSPLGPLGAVSSLLRGLELWEHSAPGSRRRSHLEGGVSISSHGRATLPRAQD